LYPIGGQVTKSKIIKALGYTPSAFDGDYNSLNNKPEIIDDGSDSFYIADTQGNIIFKVDSNGIHSVNLTLNGKTISQVIQESSPSGNYNDLENKPEIIEDGSAELNIVDPEGNIIAKITSEGIQAINFLVGEEKKEVALKENISDEINLEELNNKITQATSDASSALSAAQEAKTTAESASTAATEAKTTAEGKASASHTHTYSELTNRPDIAISDGVMHMRDSASKIQYADNSGNVIMEVDANGLTVSDVKILVNGNLISLAEAISNLLNN
jgi:hypothetical protein